MAILRLTLDSLQDLGDTTTWPTGAPGSQLLPRIWLAPSVAEGAVHAEGLHAPLSEDLRVEKLPWSIDLVDPTEANPTGWGWEGKLRPVPLGAQVLAFSVPFPMIADTSQLDGVRTIRIEDCVGLSSGTVGTPLVRPGPKGDKGDTGDVTAEAQEAATQAAASASSASVAQTAAAASAASAQDAQVAAVDVTAEAQEAATQAASSASDAAASAQDAQVAAVDVSATVEAQRLAKIVPGRPNWMANTLPGTIPPADIRFITQSGSATAAVNELGDFSFKWPEVFPTGSLSVQLTSGDSTAHNGAIALRPVTTLTTCHANAAGNTSGYVRCDYTATGY